ncbi:MAG: flagellar biosynthesis protein FlhF, partial [Paralcaligenes sp.]
MNVSRFFGNTNREAMRQVRLALGSEALIVSNRRINGGVEILATDPTVAPSEGDAVTLAAPGVALREPGFENDVHLRPGPAAALPGTDVLGAIGDLRGSLETRIDELLWGSQLRRAPQAVSLFQTLLGLGFSTALLRAMLKSLPEQLSAKAALQWVRHELTMHMPVLANEADLWVPGCALALVGPTGVGKTTTVAKLAARCIKRQGAGKVVLITTDTYRIGAHEQLKIYGQMMQTPVHIVQDVDELRRIVGGIRPDQTILIDNVGTSQRDHYIVEQAAMLAGAGRSVQRLLVLNASSQGDTLDEVARAYCNDGGSPISGCIITKLDEASRMGAALDTAIRYQLAVHYVSNGQKVPENLLFLSAADLVDQALAPRQRARALYAPTQADFAAVMSLTKTPQVPVDAAKDERRRQLLPQLLALTSAAQGAVAGAVPTQANIKAACDYLESDLACSEAMDLWRLYTSAAKAASSVPALIDQQWGTVHNLLARTEDSYVLAVHHRVKLSSQGDAAASLHATALLTGRAVALSSPMQALARAEGWLSSSGESALAAPGPGDSVRRQIEAITRRDNGVPC